MKKYLLLGTIAGICGWLPVDNVFGNKVGQTVLTLGITCFTLLAIIVVWEECNAK